MSIFKIQISLLLAFIHSKQSPENSSYASERTGSLKRIPFPELVTQISTSVVSEDGQDVHKRHLLSIPTPLDNEEDTHDESSVLIRDQGYESSTDFPSKELENEVIESSIEEVGEDEAGYPTIEENFDNETTVTDSASAFEPESKSVSEYEEIMKENREEPILNSTPLIYMEEPTSDSPECESSSESDSHLEESIPSTQQMSSSDSDSDPDVNIFTHEIWFEDTYPTTSFPPSVFDKKDLPFPPSPLLEHRKESLKLTSDLFLTFLTSYLSPVLYSDSSISFYSKLYLEVRIPEILSSFPPSENFHPLSSLEEFLASSYSDALPVYYFSDIKRKVYGDYSDYPYIHLFDENVFRNADVFSFFSKTVSDFLNNAALEVEVFGQVLKCLKSSFEKSTEEGKKLIFEIFSEFSEYNSKDIRDYKFEDHGDFLFGCFMSFLTDKEELFKELSKSLKEGISELQKEYEGVLNDVEFYTSNVIGHYKPEGVIPDLVKGSLHYSLYKLGEVMDLDFWKLEESDFEYGLVNFRADRAEKFMGEILRLDEEIKKINVNRVLEITNKACWEVLRERYGGANDELGIFRMLEMKCDKKENYEE